MAEQVVSVEDRIQEYLQIEEGEQPETAKEAVDRLIPPTQEPPEAAGDEQKPEPVVDAGVELTEAAGEPEPEVEEVQISSLRELRDNVDDLKDLSDSELYALTFPVTLPDGTSKDIPLGEVKDSYQASELLKTERARFVQEREVFEQEITQKKQGIDAAFFTAAKVLEDAESALAGNWNEVQMNDLRVNDPAEYALALTERDRAKNELVSRKTQLKGEYENLMAAQRQEFEAKQAENAYKAHQAMPQFIPEWSDENVAKQEKVSLVKYGIGEGYTEQELTSLVDPRVVRSLRKAMLYDAQQKAQPAIKKKVVSIGKKVLTSGKSKSKTERKHDEYAIDRKDFRKRGGTQDDAAALIEKHFLGDM